MNRNEDNPDVEQADFAAQNAALAIGKAMQAGGYQPPLGALVEVVSILDLPEPKPLRLTGLVLGTGEITTSGPAHVVLDIESCPVCGSDGCRPDEGVCRDAGERCECPEILARKEPEFHGRKS